LLPNILRTPTLNCQNLPQKGIRARTCPQI
jgi:hypothetical protein